MQGNINQRKRACSCALRLLGTLALLLFLGLGRTLYAQEEAPVPAPETPAGEEPSPSETPPLEPAPPASPEEEALSPELQIVEMDIKTSSLRELAAWCRSLGLSEGGTKEELANRLRGHFMLPLPQIVQEEEAVEGAPKPKKQTIITIESARSTEYFTLEVVDEEYARLRGNVVVSLKEEDAVHRISAGEILYNRTRNVMSASGGVEYRKESGDTIETFKGASITVNLDNWSSVFVGGVTEKSVTGNTTAYEFAGTLISRSDEEVTIMTQATISNAKNPEALWSLQAYKLWLLPGSDWAVLSAVLKVGEIPVLYIPFFYFPADEIIFHPVIGTRSREGNFVQTTTYLLGRPKTNPASESSISKILGNSADMEKTRQGLFLRSTGRKSRDPNDTRLSLLFDAYSNLGTYLGTEMILPPKGIFGGMDLSAGLGFTRTIYQLNSGFSPFAQYDGSDEWNKGYFFSQEIPFRYRLHTNGSLSGKYGSFTWAFPFYADPFVDQDFLDRSEEMDWVSMIKGEEEEEEDTTTSSALGSYEWRLSGTVTPSVTVLNPYVSSFSVSSLSTSLSFRTRTSALVSAASPTSPERAFFFPDKWTVYSISTSIAGTPLTLGGPKTGSPPKTDTQGQDPFQGIGSPRSPWEDPQDAETETSGALEIHPPALSNKFTIPSMGGPRLAFDYRLTPTGASELQYRSSSQNWPEQDTIDWQEVSSLLTTFGSNGSLGLTLSQPETSLYTSTFSVSGNGQWQGYTYINEEAEEFNTPTALDDAHLRSYNATFFTTSYEFSTTLKPFHASPVWGNTNMQYSFKGLLAKSVFDGTATEPSWDVEYGKWDDEDLSTHQAATNIAASIMDKVQNLTITADLPPKDATLAGNATFRVWQTETSLRGKILEPYDEEERKLEPLYLTETLRFGKNDAHSLTQEITYDPELKEYTNLTTRLSWVGIGLTASYTALRSHSYTLEESGWVQSQEEETLNPKDLQIRYTKTFQKKDLWGKRLSFSLSLNSALSFDLQRYTYSQYTFTLGVTLGIANFLDISLSTNSMNTVVFRYFQNLPFFDLPVDLPGEQNVLVDILNSFRFDNDALRRSSGFKLKSFSLNLVHHLGDWNAKLGITLSPYLDQSDGRPVYKFNNEISFLIQWVPISEIKTEINANKDKIVFK
ncbi:MAG: LPS-assembly protein LptD [Treponema sp.]|nr:LPS-assembly protein LptD [Treponema sp.]